PIAPWKLEKGRTHAGDQRACLGDWEAENLVLTRLPGIPRIWLPLRRWAATHSGGKRMREQLLAPEKAWLVVRSVACAVLLTGCGASMDNEFALMPASMDIQAPSKQETSIARLTSSDAKLAAVAADKLTSAATPGNSGYKIGPLDVLELSVFKV